ncbi:MAG: YcaO-related McrA-glycine thioamidation protein [Candidatus Methanomethylophilaceae archaeon]
MHLERSPKASRDTGIRTILPRETLDRVLPLLPKAGLQPLEDITAVDNLGIPVYSISRRDAIEGAGSVYNGKGPTPEQAQASAVMEALERGCAMLRPDDALVKATVAEAMESVFALDPRELILPERVLHYVFNDELAWCQGYELLRGEDIWVPANAVFHPYVPQGDMPLFRYHTNGIAAGNTIEEAILHGILELIERDAWSIAEFRRRARADIVIDDESSTSYQLLRSFQENGVEVHLKDLTSDIGIPTIGAAADDVRTKDPGLLTIGVGTHLNPEVAAVRALTEVAQSRTTHKHGVKVNAKLQESNRNLGYDRIKALNRMWYSASERQQALSEMERMDTPYVLDDIEVTLDLLTSVGVDKVIVVDLTRPELNVPVVRMIVPGLEVYTMDPERLGSRLYTVK